MAYSNMVVAACRTVIVPLLMPEPQGIVQVARWLPTQVVEALASRALDIPTPVIPTLVVDRWLPIIRHRLGEVLQPVVDPPTAAALLPAVAHLLTAAALPPAVAHLPTAAALPLAVEHLLDVPVAAMPLAAEAKGAKRTETCGAVIL